MATTRAAAFKSLLAELRTIGAGDLADECKQLGPDETVQRLRGGVIAMCRGLAASEQIAESLRRFRDTRP
jgi:hypothetical protein